MRTGSIRRARNSSTHWCRGCDHSAHHAHGHLPVRAVPRRVWTESRRHVTTHHADWPHAAAEHAELAAQCRQRQDIARRGARTDSITRADGVPLFLEELTKSVLESPLLHEEDRSLHAGQAAAHAGHSEHAEGACSSRVSIGAKGFASSPRLARASGAIFSYELLAAVSAKTGREFDDELEQLTATELVFRRGTPPDASYTFKHALVQDAAYDSLRQEQATAAARADCRGIGEEVPAVGRQSSRSCWPITIPRHGHLDRGDSAVAQSRRVGARTRCPAGERWPTSRRGWPLIERLPPSADRDLLELSLREPLHSARLRWRGWASPEIGVNATAILQAGPATEPAAEPAGRALGMWINTITQGRVAETPQWARRLLAEGDQSGNIDLQILGHRARHVVAFLSRRAARGARAARRGSLRSTIRSMLSAGWS